MNVMEKLRKLKAMAVGNANEHEANVALEMMTRLMLQHGIKNIEDKVDVQAVRGEWVKTDGAKQWEIWVSSGVATLFNCRVVMMRRLGHYQFVGAPDNVEAAGEVFLWVCAQVELFYKQALGDYRGSLGRTGRADLRRSFKEAAACRIGQRCQEIVAKARNDIPAHMALIVIDQSLAAADELIKGTKVMKARAVKAGIGTTAGLQAGDRVQLQGHVTGSEKKVENKRIA